MRPTILPIIAAAYVSSSLLYLHFFLTKKQAPERIGLAMLAVGFLLHTAAMAVEYINLGRLPVIDINESLRFFAWSLAGTYLAVRSSRPAAPLGTFVIPFVAISFVFSMLIAPVPYKSDDRFATILFPLHILTTFAGYASFALAFGASIMYLLQEKALKSRRPGKMLERLPSISELDMMIYHSLSMGFPLLTLGIILGAVWLRQVEGVLLKWDPKIVATLATWLLYAAIVHARLIIGWRGRRLAGLCILGFMMLLFTFIGVGIMSKGFHGFFTIL